MAEIAVGDGGVRPVVAPFGDAALLVTLGDRADPTLTALARAVATAVETLRDTAPALGRAVPAHASVLVPFDPLGMDRSEALELVWTAVATTDAAAKAAHASVPAARAQERPVVEIPVRYGGLDGPDLDEVADRLGLAARDVVELHAGAMYHVLFLGFAPGFAYLGGLRPELVTGRRATPRERVPEGSVAIAGDHTAVYPLAMPGGWNLIGRSDTRLFDPTADRPARLVPGDRIRFVPAR